MSEAAVNGDDLRSLYRELILDHARSPRHFGDMADATHSAEGINRLCGDKLRIYLRSDGDTVTDASFEGTGCAISIASASLMTETVKGMKTADARAFSIALIERLKTGSAHERLSGKAFDRLRALDGIREFPSRVKCATLAWHALNSAINRHASPASTE